MSREGAASEVDSPARADVLVACRAAALPTMAAGAGPVGHGAAAAGPSPRPPGEIPGSGRFWGVGLTATVARRLASQP